MNLQAGKLLPNVILFVLHEMGYLTAIPNITVGKAE
jgi:hypothetical protein